MVARGQVLFLQGAGAGAQDDGDQTLVDSLRRELVDELALPRDVGARLPLDTRVHVFHGLGDETAPPSHAELYPRAIPQAQVHLLPGRDHQLDKRPD